MAIGTPSVGTAVSNNTDATTLLVPYPPVVAAGDVLVLCVAVNSATQASVPSGWAPGGVASNSGGNSPAERILVKVAAGGESGNLAVTTPSATSDGLMYAFPGVDNANPLDVAGSVTNSGTATATHVLGSITTTVPGCALVTVAAAQAPGGTWNTPTSQGGGWVETAETTGTAPSMASHYLIWSGSGATGTVSLTRSSSVRGCAGMIALRPASESSPAAGTAALSLSASGAGAAAGTGTAALDLTAAGTAQAQVAGSAALALSASGTARAATTGTASLSLSATGTARAALAGAASLALTATGAARATLTGSASLLLTATGDTGGSQAATGSAALTLTANGSVFARATGTASLALTASGVVAARITGTAALLLTASGQVAARLTAAAFLDLVATGQVAVRTGGAAQLLLDAIGQAGTPTDVVIGDVDLIVTPRAAAVIAPRPIEAVATPRPVLVATR